jgi:chromate transporter
MLADKNKTMNNYPTSSNYTAKNAKSVSLFNIFSTFFRVGLFTLGGGLAMAPVIRHELVIRRKWVKNTDFMATMSLATVVPGAIAVNIAYLLGRRLRGKSGAAAAIFGTILPSFCIILLVATLLLPFFSYPKVAAFFRGCAVAIVAQLAFTGFIFGKKLLRSWKHFVVCGAGLIVVGVLGMHPLWGIVAASLFGFWLCPGNKSKKTGTGTNAD